MINSKKTIAIFGASGFIGSSLVAQLSQSNYHLKLFSRNKEKIKLFTVDPQIEIFDFDLHNLEKVKKDFLKQPLESVQNLHEYYCVALRMTGEGQRCLSHLASLKTNTPPVWILLKQIYYILTNVKTSVKVKIMFLI